VLPRDVVLSSVASTNHNALPQRIPAINNTIRARHEPAAVRSQKDSQVVQVVDGAQTLLRRVVDPDALLRLERRHSVKRRVHVARADGVDADLVARPFGGERFGELEDGGFGGVVARLRGVLVGVDKG